VVVTLAALILFDVLPTVFFAVTATYLLVGLHRRLVERGLPEWWASLAATGIATVAVAVPLAGIGYLVYRRRDRILAAIEAVPEIIRIELFGMEYAVSLALVREAAVDWLSAVAVAVLQALPVLALKVTLFALLVFALLTRHRETAEALLVPVPAEYYDVARALHERTRSTLYAIYVLQAATGVATTLIAVPVFVVLGYSVPVTLGILAGALQFLPIVGPTVLVVGLAAYQAAIGDPGAALTLLLTGSVMIGWLPDALVRPRLARETTGFPGSLYFIGFVGGLLTIGPVGIIAGPLVVALVAETIGLLVPFDDRQATLDAAHGEADATGLLGPSEAADDEGANGETDDEADEQS
jgi:predicted PurR-regulated permease PerM